LTPEYNLILDALDSSDREKKISLLSKLTQITEQTVIGKMISLLDDSDITIRGEVFSALFLNENDISEQLIKNLSSNSKNIRAFVSLILANRNDKNAINSIISLTNDPNGVVRSCAFSALGHLRANNIRQEIHRGIFDSNIEVKKSAAYALTLINEEFSNEEWIELEKQKDPDLAEILKEF